jgi:DNA recombination protein RmuC
MLLAVEAGCPEDEALARRGLEARIRLEARRIAEKYIVPPRTVEFAVLYVPTDGLFAEIARAPGMIEQVRRDHRVMVMGPSLLPAFLHTVRVGHLTIVLERKAVEIGETLRAVKAEWDRLGGTLDTLSDRAERLTKGIEETRARTRAVGRKLRGFEALEAPEAERLLGLDAADLAEVESDA